MTKYLAVICAAWLVLLAQAFTFTAGNAQITSDLNSLDNWIYAVQITEKY